MKIKFDEIEPVFGYIINSAIAYPLEDTKHLVCRSHPYVEIKGWATGN